MGAVERDAGQDYAILISLYMREEAEVMASALRAGGIDAFVGNRHHANVDWGWTIALGGMQVFVPRAKLAEAREAIRSRLKEAAEAPDPHAEPTKRRDRWKVWVVIVVSFLLPVGGMTAHTMDQSRQELAVQSAMMESFQAYVQERARLGCGPDDMIRIEKSGEATCIKPQPYPAGWQLKAPLFENQPVIPPN